MVPQEQDVDRVEERLKILSGKSRSARLRPLMQTIDELMNQGVRLKEITPELAKGGIEISVRGLYNELYRWRKRQSSVANTPSPKGSRSPSAKSPASSLPLPAASHPTPSQPLRNKGDLRRLRDQPIDLTELARLGKTLKE